MAKWQDKSEFINQNSRIAVKRLSSPQNAYLAQTPTMVTYFHINTKVSSRDKGLQNVETLTEDSSGNRFNLIKDVPLYGIDMMDLNINDDEQGLDTELDGNFILPPHVFHPFPDDFFVIDHLNRPAVFRVTTVNYDTPNGNGFFRCEFELFSIEQPTLDRLYENSVASYHCIFDHIGTANKAVILDDEMQILDKIRKLMEMLRKEYLEKFYDRKYNALMFMKFSYNKYIYDPLINRFCNKEHVFEFDEFGVADCYLFYEEFRQFNDIEYENSIYDRVSHKDLTDLDEIGQYYDLELTKNDVSVFDYEKDGRVKYLMAYSNDIGPFGNKLDRYIPKNFITALELNNEGLLTDPYEIFIYKYMHGALIELQKYLDTISKRRVKYNMHSYIFIPLTIYCLKQCYNSIICDTSVMDENLLDQYTIKKGGKT